MAELLETGHTTLIANNTKSVSSARFFADKEPIFAFPHHGNHCDYYITGREYMAAVAKAMREAQKFIFIADWQLDYDVELEQRGTAGHHGRLSEILAEALQRGVHVRVMLYDSFSKVVDTHDDTSKRLLTKLDKGKGSIEVMLQNQNSGRSVYEGQFFSHHQKFVVIDGNIAFLGGMDLAYGRWETPNFDVVIDPNIHVLNDAYNQQVMAARSMNAAEKALTANLHTHAGFRPAIADVVLHSGFQPRQPWQDVSVRIAGPAAFDVFKNFVRRWNSFANINTNSLDNALSAAWFKKIGGHTSLADPRQRGPGTQTVQICRSVSSQQHADELKALERISSTFVAAIDTYDDWKTKDANNRKIWQAALARSVGQHNTGILQAMCNCIMAAEAFIYIENQFFITECGKDQFNESAPPHNPIGHTLANKIGQAIHAKQAFHVYLVIPEHPEGKLSEAGTSSQAYWAQQSIKHGSDSLIVRIQQALFEAKLKTRLNQNALAEAIKNDPQTAARWTEYLTVLHMRNFGATQHLNSAKQLKAEYLLTEMIYVHSKLLIVDDAVAIVGSANINDRSLMGNGDTELAAVMIEESAQMLDMGQGVMAMTRQFARELRMALWKKHLGMTIEGAPHGAEKQNTPPYGIVLAQPLAQETIKGIKQLASDNARAYRTVFTHTLTNDTATLESIERLYPNGLVGAPPMLQPNYMKKLSEADVQRKQKNAAYDSRETTAYHRYKPNGGNTTLMNEIAVQDSYFRETEYVVHDVEKGLAFLKQTIKGYWTLAPLDWGKGYRKTPPAPGKNKLNPQGLKNTIAEIDDISEKRRV